MIGYYLRPRRVSPLRLCFWHVLSVISLLIIRVLDALFQFMTFLWILPTRVSLKRCVSLSLEDR